MLVSSSLFGILPVVQEFGLAGLKVIKEIEYVLAKMQGEALSKTLVKTAEEATEEAKETALAATGKAKDLARKAATRKKAAINI